MAFGELVQSKMKEKIKSDVKYFLVLQKIYGLLWISGKFIDINSHTLPTCKKMVVCDCYINSF